MVKPRTIASLIRKVLEADSKARVHYLPESDFGGDEDRYPQLLVWFTSARAYSDLKEDIDLSLISAERVKVIQGTKRVVRYMVMWNCHSIVGRDDEYQRMKPFDFDGRDDAARLRKKVTEQEEDGAVLIGGRRHRGSGSVEKLKSDASSSRWQQEAKQTSHQSFKLTVDVLDKITREARTQHKYPMVYLRFTNMPREKVASDNWIIIPEEVFNILESVG